jgi:glycosyltransferase involved in cell wall biosynthesis
VQDVNALKNAIETLLWRPDYALQLGINGRKRVESEYSPDAIYEKYKIIWERIGGKTESISN